MNIKKSVLICLIVIILSGVLYLDFKHKGDIGAYDVYTIDEMRRTLDDYIYDYDNDNMTENLEDYYTDRLSIMAEYSRRSKILNHMSWKLIYLRKFIRDGITEEQLDLMKEFENELRYIVADINDNPIPHLHNPIGLTTYRYLTNEKKMEKLNLILDRIEKLHYTR